MRGWRLGKNDDDRNHEIRLDRYIKCVITIDELHAIIHAGRAFSISGLATGIQPAAPLLFSFHTPDGSIAECHWDFEIVSDDVGTAYIFEGAAVATAGATAIVGKNRKRESSNIPYLKMYSGVATAGAHIGTLDIIRLGTAGLPNQSSGGAGTPREEWEFDENQTYLGMFVPENADTSLWFRMFWYEVVAADNW